MSRAKNPPDVTKLVTSLHRNGRLCIVCDVPLTGRQIKYCVDHSKPKHRVRRYRQKIATRAQNGVSVKGFPSASEMAKLPDDLLDLSGPEILALPFEATIRNTLLKAKLELEEKTRKIQELKAAHENVKSDRVLDPETAQQVGRWLAHHFDPSRSSISSTTPSNKSTSVEEEVMYDKT